MECLLNQWRIILSENAPKGFEKFYPDKDKKDASGKEETKAPPKEESPPKISKPNLSTASRPGGNPWNMGMFGGGGGKQGAG